MCFEHYHNRNPQLFPSLAPLSNSPISKIEKFSKNHFNASTPRPPLRTEISTPSIISTPQLNPKFVAICEPLISGGEGLKNKRNKYENAKPRASISKALNNQNVLCTSTDKYTTTKLKTKKHIVQSTSHVVKQNERDRTLWLVNQNTTKTSRKLSGRKPAIETTQHANIVSSVADGTSQLPMGLISGYTKVLLAPDASNIVEANPHLAVDWLPQIENVVGNAAFVVDTETSSISSKTNKQLVGRKTIATHDNSDCYEKPDEESTMFIYPQRNAKSNEIGQLLPRIENIVGNAAFIVDKETSSVASKANKNRIRRKTTATSGSSDCYGKPDAEESTIFMYPQCDTQYNEIGQLPRIENIVGNATCVVDTETSSMTSKTHTKWICKQPISKPENSYCDEKTDAKESRIFLYPQCDADSNNTGQLPRIESVMSGYTDIPSSVVDNFFASDGDDIEGSLPVAVIVRDNKTKDDAT